MKNKFKKGLILGSLLAGGAAIGFAMSNKGQKLSADLQKDLKPLVNKLKKDLSKLQDVTKENFNEAVEAIVREYSQKKKIAADTQKALTKALQAKWREMEKEYSADS